jgi:VCBS repeat protein
MSTTSPAHTTHRFHRLSVCSLAITVLGSTASSQFVNNTTDIPTDVSGNGSSTENVDFADVDNDGDWDAAFADGGDDSRDQNRIWINQGGTQGGTIGVFADETTVRFPAFADQSRDIEFVDIDGDLDPDIYVSSVSTITPTTNHWLVNSGSFSGVYVNQTSTRWVNLGGAGSSIQSSDVLPGGGFIDFSCDSDFADLDNDGDMDLFHSSYGGQFHGQQPSRIFLNDGAGYFEEYNPSGYQLATRNIADGEPGLWCEGTQDSNTVDVTGAFCDIASTSVDIELGDLDGDFDIDVLHGARQELPRLFQNRLEENGGSVLGFRDITGSLPAGYATGDGHYEQELGDLDGDGDLDIYGVNWAVASFSFDDVILENDGTGSFAAAVVISSSGSDDSEADFFDYDLDGDLDVFVTNYTGSNKLYRNSNNGGTGISLSTAPVAALPPSAAVVGLDSDACDLDGDGDYDLMLAIDNNRQNQYWQNTTRHNGVGPVDTHAPYIPNVEQVPDRVASNAPTVVRAQVYDNAPYYITWYNETWLEVRVDGGTPFTVPMVSSGGQIFRGELAGALVGNISYQVFSKDEYGNTGSSAIYGYQSVVLGTPYCSGDGSDGTDCQCGNNSALGSGQGCLNSQNHGAILFAAGSASLTADDLRLRVLQARPHQPALFVQGDASISVPFKDGKLCVGGSTERLGFSLLGGAGSASSASFSISAAGNITTPGAVRYYQAWYRDPAISVCGQGSNFTGGLALTWQP